MVAALRLDGRPAAFGAGQNPTDPLAIFVGISRLTVLPLMSPVDSVYGKLRAQIERAGTPIGPNDLLIAAHALAHGHTLVTDNLREFSRVKGLASENWLR